MRACSAALIVVLALTCPAALAAWPSVDGISDQSLPLWDGGFGASYFARLLRDVWIGRHNSHIALARYVLQWNAMSGSYPRYRAQFESWLADVASVGLAPELALTSYDGAYPASSAEYKARLGQILRRAEEIGHPIRYVEPWNEPNGQGKESALNAAAFTNSAYALCEKGYSCTTIAGNVQDSPSVGAYIDRYTKALAHLPTIWGVHPYYSVEAQSEAPVLRLIEHLPRADEKIWFTEIAARKCTDFNGHFVEHGETGQAERAKWLVHTLIADRKPEHVFYYELLLGGGRQPSCASEGADGALYLPGGDSNAPDYPRPAASYIFDGKSLPWAYTGDVANVDGAQATLTGSIYPGGFLSADYRFEYGPTTRYGAFTSESQAGPDSGQATAQRTITGLTPGAIYHYRLVAWNAEGSTGGEDHMFSTPGPFEELTGVLANSQQQAPQYIWGSASATWISSSDALSLALPFGVRGALSPASSNAARG